MQASAQDRGVCAHGAEPTLPVCPTCGYDLSHTPGEAPRCPECGTRTHLNELLPDAKLEQRTRKLLFATKMLGFLASWIILLGIPALYDLLPLPGGVGIPRFLVFAVLPIIPLIMLGLLVEIHKRTGGKPDWLALTGRGMWPGLMLALQVVVVLSVIVVVYAPLAILVSPLGLVGAPILCVTVWLGTALLAPLAKRVKSWPRSWKLDFLPEAFHTALWRDARRFAQMPRRRRCKCGTLLAEE